MIAFWSQYIALQLVGVALFWLSISRLAARQWPKVFAEASEAAVAWDILMLVAGLVIFNINKWKTKRPSEEAIKQNDIVLVLCKLMLFPHYAAMLFLFLRIVCIYALPIFGMSIPPISQEEISWWLPIIVVTYVGNDVASRYLMLALTGGAYESAVRTQDTRPPVIYLRSFDKEGSKHRSPALAFSGLIGDPFYSVEIPGVLATYLNRIGPLVALGRPSEKLVDMSGGFARRYVTNEEWQEVVSKFLCEAAAVVLEVSDTDSLKWEMKQMVKITDELKVLLILPASHEGYSAFRAWASKILPIALPESHGRCRIMIFQKGWRPKLLPFMPGVSLTPTLVPFYEQNGLGGYDRG